MYVGNRYVKVWHLIATRTSQQLIAECGRVFYTKDKTTVDREAITAKDVTCHTCLKHMKG